jgi:hypothetical protein
MKHRLGFILSCTHALILMGVLATMILGSPNLGYSLEVYCGYTVWIMSFPLGLLSELFSGGHHGSFWDLVLYFILMIPNSFIWGYFLAGLIREIAGLFRTAPSTSDDPQSPK